MLATRASTAVKYTIRGHKGAAGPLGVNTSCLVCSVGMLRQEEHLPLASAIHLCVRKVGTLVSRAISVPHTGGYATVGYWLDCRYYCQTMSLTAREPTHFVCHFEKAARSIGK